MKKILPVIAAVLAVLLLVVYYAPVGEAFPRETVMNLGGVLLLAVVVFYAQQYGGIRCPNCSYRINPKYGRRKAFEGRFACPKCGSMIEL